MHNFRDRKKIEFIRSVVKELNYALNSQSVDTTVAVHIITDFERFDPDCFAGDIEIELTYPKGN